MNPKKSLDSFRILKEEVMKDGIIDEREVNVLLSFLEPYTRTYSVKFTGLSELLHEGIRNGVSKELQGRLWTALDEAERFLEFEYKVERFIGYAIAAIVLVVGFVLAIR